MSKAEISKEEELEQFVFDNLDKYFGKDRIFIEKKRITTKIGKYGIPDGIVLDISSSELCIIENEMKSHDPYKHIIPQVMRYIIASKNKHTRDKLRNVFIKEILVDKDKNVEMFKRNFPKLDDLEIFRQIDEILDNKPRLFIFIDEINRDLEEFCLIVKDHLDIKAVKVVKFMSEGKPAYYFDDDEYLFSSTESSMIKEKKASEKYYEIFKMMLDELKKLRPDITNRDSSKNSVLQISFGISRFHLEWYIMGREPNKELQTGIHFENKNPNINRAVFDHLQKFEKDMNEKIANDLVFKREWLSDGDWSAIYVIRQIGTFQALFDSKPLKEWAVDSMIKLYDFIMPHLDDLKKIINGFK